MIQSIRDMADIIIQRMADATWPATSATFNEWQMRLDMADIIIHMSDG